LLKVEKGALTQEKTLNVKQAKQLKGVTSLPTPFNPPSLWNAFAQTTKVCARESSQEKLLILQHDLTETVESPNLEK